MCIRDRIQSDLGNISVVNAIQINYADQEVESDHLGKINGCLLYTSDAADERSSVDLGGRRIIKKKTSMSMYGSS